MMVSNLDAETIPQDTIPVEENRIKNILLIISEFIVIFFIAGVCGYIAIYLSKDDLGQGIVVGFLALIAEIGLKNLITDLEIKNKIKKFEGKFRHFQIKFDSNARQFNAIATAIRNLPSNKNIIHDVDPLMEKFNEIKEIADQVCYLFWCGDYREADLTKYFQDEATLLTKKPANFHLHRIISERIATPMFITDHKIYRTNIPNNKYDFRKSDIEHFEMVFADYIDSNDKRRHHIAMLVMLDPHTGDAARGYVFDSKNGETDRSITLAIKEIFKREWRKAPAII